MAKKSFGTLALLLLVAPDISAFGADGQAGLLGQAASLDSNGHHDTRNRAVEKGFNAFADLASLNIPGAISNGIQAFGSYNDSQQFNQLNSGTSQRQDSLGAGGGAGATVSGNAPILAAMDHSELYQGSLGEAAGRAEQAFGWNREQMFNMAASWETQVLQKVDSGQSVTGALFGDVMEEARKLIPSVPNADTRKALEQVSAIVTPKMAESTLDKITAGYVVPTSGPSTVTNAKNEPAGNAAAGAAAETATVGNLANASVAGELTGKSSSGPNRQLAEANRSRELKGADAATLERINREDFEGGTSPLLLEPSDGDPGSLLAGYFPGERTIFQMIRTQTVKFQRNLAGRASR